MVNKIIYGINTAGKITPEMVRDAVVRCFTRAHKEILDSDLSDLAEELNPKELERLETLNIRQMIEVYFRDVGGDFNKPDKKSIIAVCDKLAAFSLNFRGDDVIKKYYDEILQLVKKLK